MRFSLFTRVIVRCLWLCCTFLLWATIGQPYSNHWTLLKTPLITLIGRCGCSLGFPKKPLWSAHFFGKKMCVCNVTDLEVLLEATKKHKKLRKSGNQSIKLILYFTCNERIFEIQNNHSSNISFLKSKVFQRGQNVYKDQKI